MSDNGQVFPYEKVIVLNAVYDALDALSFTIDRSNSARGTLMVSSSAYPQTKGRIAVSPTLTGEQTLVEVFAGADEDAAGWVTAFMDEVRSLIRRAEANGRKK